LRVTAGWTELTLTPGPVRAGSQHLAFTIPRNTFAGAKTWLRARLPLLRTDEGDEFECSPFWNARSLYFEGPDNCVLEFIIRRNLPNDATGDFGSRGILGVSEVGIPVADVPAFEGALRKALNLQPYGQGGATFRPMGDEDGLLIAVEHGRSWFPTAIRAEEQRLLIGITSGATGELWANGQCRIRAAEAADPVTTPAP
ncbi:MAG TPA: hypothetical protein VIG41_01470, partial [Micrococcaceae bacterium]